MLDERLNVSSLNDTYSEFDKFLKFWKLTINYEKSESHVILVWRKHFSNKLFVWKNYNIGKGVNRSFN